MINFLLSLVMWLILWIGGWIGLRSIPGGLDLLNPKLFLNSKTKLLLFVNLGLLVVIFLCIIFFNLVYRDINIFRFRLDDFSRIIILIFSAVSVANFLAFFLLKVKKTWNLFLSFIVTLIYFFLNNLFQQLINFEILQNGLASIVKSSTILILATGLFFGLSHFTCLSEKVKLIDAYKLVLLAIPLGIFFSYLRWKYGSILPGLLIHFSIYLMINGPLILVLHRKYSSLIS